jgi:hypothetical protein
MNVTNGGTIVRFIAALLLVAVVIGLGVATYNAGVSAGLTEAAQQALASGDPTPVVPVYGYGPYVHGPFAGGWGFFGFFFWILGFFLILALLRAVFGWGRWGRGSGGGPRGPNGWGGGSRAEEWHRELHRRSGEESGV